MTLVEERLYPFAAVVSHKINLSVTPPIKAISNTKRLHSTFRQKSRCNLNQTGGYIIDHDPVTNRDHGCLLLDNRSKRVV